MNLSHILNESDKNKLHFKWIGEKISYINPQLKPLNGGLFQRLKLRKDLEIFSKYFLLINISYISQNPGIISGKNKLRKNIEWKGADFFFIIILEKKINFGKFCVYFVSSMIY